MFILAIISGEGCFMYRLISGLAMGIDNDTFRWVIGALLGVITSIGGFWLSNITAKVDEINRDLLERSQRISVLEANVDGFNRRLDRIETKIDYLIQERTKIK
jgi:hypothetical protein